MVKLLFIIENICRNNLIKWKGALLKFYLVIHGCKVGKGLRCHRFPTFKVAPLQNITIGDRVTISEYFMFNISVMGKVIIGNDVKASQHVSISSNTIVEIGDHCLLAEFVNIHDDNHITDRNTIMTTDKTECKPVLIEKNTWIGAGSFILKGAHVPEGVVIGANSVVTGTLVLQPYSIYAGSPARLIRERH